MDFSVYEGIITKRLIYFCIVDFIALVLSIICIIYLFKKMRDQKVYFWILLFLSCSVIIGSVILTGNVAAASIHDITKQAYIVKEGEFKIDNDVETRSGTCSLILSDGTKLETDAYDFSTGIYVGRVVYGEKTRLVLEIEVLNQLKANTD